jgi:hypothetical protein
MPVSQDTLISSAVVGGIVADGELDALARDHRLRVVRLRSDAPPATWEALDDRLFRRRDDVILAVDSFFPGGADLSLLRHVPNVRRLCVTSPGKEGITSVESIAMLPHLEALQIGSPAIRSFDFLDVLPPDRLRELRLADTLPHKPSLGPVARFTGLHVLRIEGHSVDLEALASLRSLRQLTLTSVRLSDLTLLRAFRELASFSLAACTVKDVGVLGQLGQLRHLNVFQSKGFEALAFLVGMWSLEMLKLGNLPKVLDFPDLSKLARLRRVSLLNLKRLERLDGLAKAPGLDAYMHLAVPGHWTPEHFRCLLEHPTLREFTAIVGGRKKDAAIRELAARMGKVPVKASTEDPFVFKL